MVLHGYSILCQVENYRLLHSYITFLLLSANIPGKKKKEKVEDPSMSLLGEFFPGHESFFVQLWSWMSHAVLGALPTVLEGDGSFSCNFYHYF